MEINRFNLNKLKTILLGRVNYISKVYESIENETHYDVFISMCDTHFYFCQFWRKKFKPLFGRLSYKKYKIYSEYVEYAQYTLNILQNLINEYNETIQKSVEEEEFIESIRKKLTAEFLITKELKEASDNLIKSKTSKIGFKHNVNKNNENVKENLDNTNS